MRSPREAFIINNGEITIFKGKSKVTYQLKDIKVVAFNFNVPYLAIVFAFSITMNDGEEILISSFVGKQIKVYRLMKKILMENHIEITRTFLI
jgi:hypothetical protein